MPISVKHRSSLVGGSLNRKGLYKVQTVARMTGFTPAALRTWEVRYDLLHPERTERGHRLYTQHDLGVLNAVKRLMDEGLHIGEIAHRGRDVLLGLKPSQSGEGLAAPGTTWMDGVIELMRQGDLEGFSRRVDEELQAWSRDSRVAECAGTLWVRVESDRALELPVVRFAERFLAFRLGELLLQAAPLGQHLPRAVLGGFPGDADELSLLAAGYLLARNGWRVIYLGLNQAFADMEKALQLFEPELVYLNVSRSSIFLVHEPGLLQLVEKLPDSTRLWVGGRGLCEQVDAPYLQSPGPLQYVEFQRQVGQLGVLQSSKS